jgi:hypothetical protein
MGPKNDIPAKTDSSITETEEPGTPEIKTGPAAGLVETEESPTPELERTRGKSTPDPDGKEKKDPDGKTTPDPDGKEKKDPDGKTTPDPDGKEKKDPDGKTTPDPDGKEKKDPVRQRINILTKEKTQAVNKVIDLAKARGLEPVLDDQQNIVEFKPIAPAKARDLPPKPKQEAFDNYDDYIIELSAWSYKVEKLKESNKTAAAAPAANDSVKAQQEAIQGRLEKVKTFNAAAPKDLDGYMDLINNKDLKITAAMGDTLMDPILVTRGHEIAYSLGKNPDEAARIAGLPPAQQVVEIMKMETTLTGKASKKASETPDPINPIDGAGGAGEPDPEKMTQAEYEKWRDEGGGS